MKGKQIRFIDCFRHGQWLLLIMSPALCFISSVIKIKKGEVRASWSIPFIMGIIAYLYPPYSDFARLEDGLLDLLNEPLINVIMLRGDLIVTSVVYLFLKCGIPIEFFRFLYTFIGYYFITKIFVSITQNKSLSAHSIFYIWFFLFMQIEFFGFVDNIRTIFVRIILFYCMYQYFIRDINKYRYYSLFLIPVHFAYFPILLLFFFSKYFVFKFSRRTRVFVIVTYFFGGVISDFVNLSAILSLFDLGEALNKSVMVYTEGEWSSEGDSMNSYSLAFKIYSRLSSLGQLYLMFAICKLRCYCNVGDFCVLLGLLCMVTVSIPVLAGRYYGFFNIAISLFFLFGYINGLIKHEQMKIFCVLCLLKIALDIYAYWNSLVNGNVIFVFLPLPLALFQTYNFVEWRNNRLTEDFNSFVNGSFLTR